MYYDADGNGAGAALQFATLAGAPALTAEDFTVQDPVSDKPYTPGQAVIDLGVQGKLIHPTNVDGNWYYVWDMNGDGVHDDTQDTSGKWNYDGSVANPSGTGYLYDYVAHGVLDGIFTQDVIGTSHVGDTTDTTRYATLNDVRVALPTLGGALPPSGSYYYAAGTEIDNTPAGEANSTYNDYMAIWDAHNGTENSAELTGVPSGWQASYYWSATPSGDGHAFVNLGNGYVYVDSGNSYVALQVL